MFEDKPINLNFQKLDGITYVYTAGGTVYLNQSTATERTATTAKSWFWIEILGNDEYFFEKKNSARLNIQKIGRLEY